MSRLAPRWLIASCWPCNGRSWVLACWLATLLAGLQGREAHAVENKYWQTTPYRVQATLAIDSDARLDDHLAEQIGQTMRRRVTSTVSPLWDFQLQLSADQQRYQQLQPSDPKTLRPINWDLLSPEEQTLDKIFTLSITSDANGYLLRCQEYDVYLRRMGTVSERRVHQRSFLGEQAFQMLLSTFSPLATVEPLPDNEQQVRLVFRGSKLPSRTGEFGGVAPLIHSGQAYLPLLRRTNRAGELLENGIRPIPWTYVTTTKADGDHWLADVSTGSRKPFGSRRRGSVQKLAVGLDQRLDRTQVRFHARNATDIPLRGYEVFVRDDQTATSELLGVTDAQGAIPVAASSQDPVTTLFLRSDGQVLAKIPIAPGSIAQVEVPIADDPIRLQAQSELTEIREQLIDVVARRAIYMARIRARIEEGKAEEANELMTALNNLPNRAAFDMLINAAERSSKSEDPKIQQRIAKLFGDTRALLVRFLDSRPITELQSEVNAAKPGTNRST